MKTILCLLCLTLVGCTSLSSLAKRSAAKFSIKTPTKEVTQSGDVAQPARVVTTTNETLFDIEPGSTVTLTYTPSVKIPFVQRHVTETIAAPVAHTPPSGPTVGEIAKADGLRWFYLGGLACGLGALVALWRGHPVNAAILGGGAVVVPIIGNLVSSDAALKVLIAAACVSAGIALAYFILKRRNPEIASKT